MRENTENSKKVKNARCYGDQVVGCKNYDAFAMIAIAIDGDGENRIMDFMFPDRATLESLRNEINGLLGEGDYHPHG